MEITYSPVPSPGGRRGIRRRLYVLAALLVVLLVAATVSAYYLATRQPLTQVVGIQAVMRSVAPAYSFSLYGVTSPLGVALSPDGQRLYVAESRGERRVVAFDRSGKFLATLVPPHTEPGDRLPTYVAVDKKGQVYVSDRVRRVVDVFDARGKYVRSLVPDALRSGGWMPLGLFIDGGDRLYVADVTTGFHRIMVLDGDRQLKLAFGKQGRQVGELNFPNGLVVDRRGRIVVANGNNGRLEAFDLQGEPLGAFGAGSGPGTVGIPRGLALDDLPRLYAVDTASHLVNVYDDSSDEFKFLFSFGKEGRGDGELENPTGIAVDKSGRVYVADSNNHRVEVWTY